MVDMKDMMRLLLLALLIGGSFVTGAWYNQRSRVEASTPAAALGTAYACPMHPEYRSARPGDCPACGMALTAVVPAVTGRQRPLDSEKPPEVGVTIDPRARHLAGVRVLDARVSSFTHTLRLVGRVIADESRVYTLNAGIDGYIREVSPVTTGSFVRKGQTLATFASPEAIPAIQNYLVALNAIDRLKQSGGEGAAQAQIGSTSSNFQQRTEKLEDLGLSHRQLEEMERTHQVPKGIEIAAPADGFVVARNISPGQKFSRGTEWYRIADISRVWILADVFGTDADRLRSGATVTVSLPDRRRSFDARVSEVLPSADPVTRTLRVRLEVNNPDYVLRQDMFVDVEVRVTVPSVIAVPADAVADSGLRQVVFVESGAGAFEPRLVETGARFGDQVEIVKGLRGGERIATSGVFLLESERRMQTAAERR
jgi:membrane fusion protein, copper/silver efflux system